MTDVSEFKKEDSNWYLIDGMNFNGEKAAQAYLDSRDELNSDADVEDEDESVEEEAAVEEETVEVEDVVEETADHEESDSDAQVLIEMTRPNRVFGFVGKNKRYTFRQNSKIQVVREEDVQDILAQTGFRVVDPLAAKEYYS